MHLAGPLSLWRIPVIVRPACYFPKLRGSADYYGDVRSGSRRGASWLGLGHERGWVFSQNLVDLDERLWEQVYLRYRRDGCVTCERTGFNNSRGDEQWGKQTNREHPKHGPVARRMSTRSKTTWRSFFFERLRGESKRAEGREGMGEQGCFERDKVLFGVACGNGHCLAIGQGPRPGTRHLPDEAQCCELLGPN